jgi:hypothetical protein
MAKIFKAEEREFREDPNEIDSFGKWDSLRNNNKNNQ